ncbi:serine--tRNA ligase [Prevotella sp. HUN102]|uniref:serine--tRNA ligase n=1 Tax=Prevotella sp. HUN102 TaxID=1392486 RepID=UPI00048E3899|nr:serine--tRNA ligase [Prevotella sp. HUN102]
MLTLKLISEETERVIKGLEKKHFAGAREAIEKVLDFDKTRRECQQKLDNNKQQQNQLSKQIGSLMKEGKKDEANEIKNQVAELKIADKTFQEEMDKAQQDMTEILLTIPNIANENVPEGKDASQNVVIREGGEKPALEGEALCHWDFCKKYNLVDFDLGVKITGAGFPIYIGKMARFQRALEAFFLEEARKSGYLEVQPPLLVNQASGLGTGQLPDKEGQMYHAQLDDLYLIPTAEVPVTNIFRDEILDEKALPIKRCAYSSCFRREAGSYGKDVRGLNRLHQFDKVEIVRIDTPQHSYDSLKEMLEHVEGLLKKLELPYHILLLCGGDMSFTSSICYDFEVWSAAQERWLEVSSVSNFESYQANRLHCRFRHSDDKKIELCHTLNGSALALPRIVAAIIENNQTPEGIRVPKALVPYCGFEMLDDKNF